MRVLAILFGEMLRAKRAADQPIHMDVRIWAARHGGDNGGGDLALEPSESHHELATPPTAHPGQLHVHRLRSNVCAVL